MKNWVVRTEELTRKFGELIAVDKLSMKIPPGEIYGFLGPNGSGKSTTIRLICGLLTPTSGHVEALGYAIPEKAEELKNHLGYMTQKFSLYEDLSVRENLQFLAEIQSVPRRDRQSRIKELLTLFRLEDRQDQLAGTMSGGQKQRLALAGSIIHNPDLLILDEPTSAVDPESRREFWEYLFELIGRGMSILVSTHYMDEAERCHRIAILQEGKLSATGEPEGLMESLHAEVYLMKGSSRELIRWREALVADPHIPGCTQIGNSLRIMVDKDLQSEEKDLSAWLRKSFPFMKEIPLERTYPNLEDVFVRATVR